jgi:diguanylate cyclase (GGDEF)-like protein
VRGSRRFRSRYGRAAVFRAGLLVFALTAALVGAVVVALDGGARRSAEQQQAAQLAGAARVSVSALAALRADLRAQAGQIASSLPLQRAIVKGDRKALERIARARRAQVTVGGRTFGSLVPEPRLAARASIDDGGRSLARVTITVPLDGDVLALLRQATPLTGHMSLLLVRDGRVLAGGPAGARVRIHDGRIELGSTEFSAHVARGKGDSVSIVAIDPRSAISEHVAPYRRRLLLAAAVTLALAAGVATLFGRPVARALSEVSRLRRQAQTDALTGLANRRGLDERLDEELDRARRLGTSLAYVIADIDRFKDVNDKHGHRTGDAVLRAVAGVFADSIRELDLAARFGGEELALVLPGTQLAGARRLAERIRTAVEQLSVRDANGDLVRVTVSFGAAAFPAYADVDEIVGAADAALYEAKRTGRNRVVTAKAPRRRPAAAAAHP